MLIPTRHVAEFRILRVTHNKKNKAHQVRMVPSSSISAKMIVHGVLHVRTKRIRSLSHIRQTKNYLKIQTANGIVRSTTGREGLHPNARRSLVLEVGGRFAFGIVSSTDCTTNGGIPWLPGGNPTLTKVKKNHHVLYRQFRSISSRSLNRRLLH